MAAPSGVIPNPAGFWADVRDLFLLPSPRFAILPALPPNTNRWYNYSIAMKYECPICKKAVDSGTNTDFPFCSERCRMLDLGAWAAEKYFVSEPIFDEEEIPAVDRRALHEGGRKNNDTVH